MTATLNLLTYSAPATTVCTKKLKQDFAYVLAHTYSIMLDSACLSSFCTKAVIALLIPRSVRRCISQPGRAPVRKISSTSSSTVLLTFREQSRIVSAKIRKIFLCSFKDRDYIVSNQTIFPVTNWADVWMWHSHLSLWPKRFKTYGHTSLQEESMRNFGKREGLKSIIAYMTVETRWYKGTMKEVGARHIKMVQALIWYLVWFVVQEEGVVK